MELELGKYRDPVFEAEYKAYIQSRVPERIFDAHVHLNQDGPLSHKHVTGDEDIAYWRGFMEDIVGAGRMRGGLMLPDILPKELVPFINDYTVREVDAHPGTVAGMLVHFDQTKEEVEAYLDAHPNITTFKPYLRYSKNPVPLKSLIDEFVPEWAWEIADRRRLSMTLHIGCYQQGLCHPDTLNTVIRRCNDHPNMRLILAHCALAHNPDTLKKALPAVRRLDNLYFDTSGITEPAAICHVLDGFGSGKLLYGSDLPFGSTLGRIVQLGSGLLGLDPMLGYLKADFPMDYDCCFIPNAMEGFITLFTALDAFGVTAQEARAIFWDNARWVFRLDESNERTRRAQADAFDRTVRAREDIGYARMAKGCQVWTKRAVPFIDTCSAALENRPLGYADMLVGQARRNATVTEIPAGFDDPQKAELIAALRARYPWSKQVALTVSRDKAEEIANACAGQTLVLGEALGNGAPIAAALLERDIDVSVPAPTDSAVAAALASLAQWDEQAENALDAIRERVLQVWTRARARYQLPASIDREQLAFTMPQGTAMDAFVSAMREDGFLAGARFIPTLAHTPSVLDRYAAAADRAFHLAAEAIKQ